LNDSAVEPTSDNASETSVEVQETPVEVQAPVEGQEVEVRKLRETDDETETERV
jgi:hypothetical protein